MKTVVEKFLTSSQQRCNNLLAKLVAEQAIPSTKLDEALRYSLLSGGKRIRPALVYAAASAIGEINPCSDYFACALEALHCYSLIHDDLPAMDDDALRRGQPTCHKVFGEAHAILAGDALQGLAFEWVAKAPASQRNENLRALVILANAAGPRGMVGGQALDIEAQGGNMSLEALEAMQQRKTGALIQASLALGGLSNGADEAQLACLEQFARAIGLAFQVQDDILDVEMDTKTLGKQQGADAERHKPTYVSLLGLEGAKSKCQSLMNSAMASLLPLEEKAAHLRQLAEYIVNRNH